MYSSYNSSSNSTVPPSSPHVTLKAYFPELEGAAELDPSEDGSLDDPPYMPSIKSMIRLLDYETGFPEGSCFGENRPSWVWCKDWIIRSIQASMVFSGSSEGADVCKSTVDTVGSLTDTGNRSEDEVDGHIELVEEIEISDSEANTPSSADGSNSSHAPFSSQNTVTPDAEIDTISTASDTVEEESSDLSMDSASSPRELSNEPTSEAGMTLSDDTEMVSSEEVATSPLEDGEIGPEDDTNMPDDKSVDMSISGQSSGGDVNTSSPVPFSVHSLKFGFQTPVREANPTKSRLPATFPTSRVRYSAMHAPQYTSPSVRYQPYSRPVTRPGDWNGPRHGRLNHVNLSSYLARLERSGGQWSFSRTPPECSCRNRQVGDIHFIPGEVLGYSYWVCCDVSGSCDSKRDWFPWSLDEKHPIYKDLVLKHFRDEEPPVWAGVYDSDDEADGEDDSDEDNGEGGKNQDNKVNS